MCRLIRCDALEQELSQLKSQPITLEVLAHAKNRVLGGLDNLRDDIKASVYIVGCFVASDVDLATLGAWPQALESGRQCKRQAY